MASKTRTWWLVGSAVAAVAVVGAGVAVWAYGQEAYWAVASTWALDEDEAAAVAECGDPGWMGLMRVLEQDLAVPCPADWFAGAAKDHVKKRNLLRLRWLRHAARDPQRTDRARFRAASTLLLGGHETLPGLAILTRSVTLSSGRERLAEVVAEGAWPGEWADPDLRGDAALRTLVDDDADGMSLAVARLRHEALVPDGDAALRERLVDAGLQVLGLGDGVLQRALDRRDRGLAQHELPVELHAAVVNHGHVCRERASSACLEFVAELLDERIGEEDRPERPQVTLPVPLWEVLEHQRPDTVPVRADAAGAAAAWVAEAPEQVRAERLEALLVGGDARFPGRAGDPADVLRRHAGHPWTVALAALSVAELAQVDVGVAADGAGVWLRLGERDLRLQPCGALLPVGDEDVRGTDWPATAVLAQAALEAAAEAGEPAVNRRLVVFAARLDPIGAGPVSEAVEPGTSLGAQAAAVVSPPGAAAPGGAEASRERVGAWAAAHAGDRLLCAEGAP